MYNKQDICGECVLWDYKILTYHAVEKTHDHARNIRGMPEESHRHERILRNFFLVEDEDGNHYYPKNNQTDGCWRIPGESSTT